MIRIFTISLLLALCACTDQQTELGDASRALRFGVESIEDTKGSIINTSNIRSMSVFCAHTGKEQYSSTATCNWMHNAAVTRADENSEWTVQGDGVNKQWKDDGYHSFFAFAPHAPEGAKVSLPETQGPPTLTYTVPTDHTKQVDLLYSLTTPINCKQMYIGSRPVVFGFRHALSKITFDAKKEDIVTDEVTITNIRLSSIINKARYEFTMKDGYAEVANISSVKTSTDTTSFSITPNQVLTNESTILLPANQALFMINQSFTANNKLYVTYNKGAEIGKTITADLSVVTPEGWDFSKAYRYSILVKEDKVTITAQITDWNDQAVDVAVPGTYLNVAQLGFSFKQGIAGDIYYSTDGSPVTATCDKDITLDHDSDAKKFTFPSTAAVGNYTVAITAGKLTRMVSVVVKPNGTFLTVNPSSLSLNKGTAGDITYDTDGSPVTATCDKGITLTHDPIAKKFTFPSTAPVGTYTVTITAGSLTQNVPVEVKSPPYIQIGNLLWATGNLVKDGPNGCKIGQPQDGGLYFQWGSLIGWTGGANGDGTGQPNTSAAAIIVKPTGYNSFPTWANCPKGSMTVSASTGKGDPCKHYLGDGWRLPNPNEWGNGWDPTNTGKPINCISGKYMSASGTSSNPRVWFENAGNRGYADGSLTYTSAGWTAYYWTNQQYSNGNNYWWFLATQSNIGFQQTNSFGYPIRCVKPVGTTPEPEVPDFIVEDGVAAPRIFVQGTGNEAKLMLTKNPANYGVYFQFGGLIAWNYKANADKGTPIFNIYNSGYAAWKSDAVHSIANIQNGKGDPCKLVGYTVSEIKALITNRTLPDNKKWKTPSWNATDPFFVTEQQRPGGYKNISDVKGHYFPRSTSTDNFLPAAGLAEAGGWMQNRNVQGFYWTNTPKENANTAEANGFEEKSIYGSQLKEKSCAFPIRCVRQ